MDKLLESVKAKSLAWKLSRYILGIGFVFFGFVAGYFFGNIWIIVGIGLAMLESISLIALSMKKNKDIIKLIDSGFNEYIPELKMVNSASEISNAFDIFDMNNISNSSEILFTHAGTMNDVKISCATISCRFNGRVDRYFVRMYALEANMPINANINSIKNKYFINYRYEIRGNKLYLITLSKGARGRMLSINPTYYHKYSNWTLRLRDEKMLIEEIVKLIGGNK